MITRYALFEGEIHPGRETQFRDFVQQRLVPLWVRFPGALEVRVTFEVSRDDGAASYPLVLAVSYPDLAAVETALQSKVRFESREVTRELLTMFTGTVHHHVCDALTFAPAA